MEGQETEMSAAGQDGPTRRRDSAADAAADSAWRMPDGEDLLRFALSAGLATGALWLETQVHGAPPRGEAPSPAHAGSGERQ
jgi:hypothetical protein